MNAEPKSDDADAEDDQVTAVESAAELLADESQARLWLRAILPILQQRSAEPDHCPSVQAAYDRMYRAAADRATRILRADMIG